MASKKDLYLLLPIYIVGMIVLISDFKLISNQVGAIVTVASLFVMLIGHRWHASKLDRKTIIYVILFLLYYTATSLMNFDQSYWMNHTLYFIMMFAPFLLSVYILNKESQSFIKYFLVVFFITWNIFLALNLKTCIEDPELARHMCSNRKFYIMVINGGGYYMGYGSAVLIPYFLNNLLNGVYKNKIVRIIIAFEIVFMVFVILNIHSFVILVATIIGILVVLISRVASRRSRIFYYSFVGIFFAILYLNAATILPFFIRNTQNEFWKKRFQETYESVVMDSNSNHVEKRNEVYEKSLDGFWENPVFGNGYKFGNVFNTDDDSGVGNHSSILDGLSQYGIIGSIPYFLFLLFPWKRSKKYKYDNYHLVSYYTLLFLNPVFNCYHTMLIVYFVIPALEKYRLRIPTEKRIIKIAKRYR